MKKADKTLYLCRKKVMKTINIKPQFVMDELVRFIFPYQRIVKENGEVSYEAVDPPPIKTGIDALDALLRQIERGVKQPSKVAKNFGISVTALSGFTFMLTGFSTREFIRAYELKQIDLLLRYTDLSVKEMNKKFGFGTTGNIHQLLLRNYKQSILERKKHLRQLGDLGKFVFEKPSPQAVRKMKVLYISA